MSYTLAKTLSGQKYKAGIPILLIYFLGERLEYFEEVPILLVDLTAKDGRTMTPLLGTNHFIEALFHKGIKTCCDGIFLRLKWLFSAHTVPFFSHVVGLCSFKKPSCGQKIAHFYHHATPSQQV